MRHGKGTRSLATSAAFVTAFRVVASFVAGQLAVGNVCE